MKEEHVRYSEEDPLQIAPLKYEPHTIISQVGPYNCPNCERIFNDYLSLKRHIKRQHKGDIEIVSCPVCGKKMQKRSLTQHMVQHTEPSFQCSNCPKKFVSEAIRTRHNKLTHQNYRPLKCEICGKGFRSNMALKVHSVVHTGEKPYTR